MAPFAAKRKGRQSFAPRFVYPPEVQISEGKIKFRTMRARIGNLTIASWSGYSLKI